MSQIILFIVIFNIDSVDSIVYFNHIPYTSLNRFCDKHKIEYKWNQYNESFTIIHKSIIFKQDEPFVNIQDSSIRCYPPIKHKNQLFINTNDLKEILWNRF